ncbi:sporulation related protein [Pacificibacter maritimus]|uniref:Sporulation related protein n=1 Tax=Pacificibacter maritimus TaxID=762213 RepID=A0A3N4VFZ5_9RHOB|nr:SPOR domain-containing protein [Pacificibacter maritimus]RPE71874.1 sporulation related protein [Pacificibacter maritimus]
MQFSGILSPNRKALTRCALLLASAAFLAGCEEGQVFQSKASAEGSLKAETSTKLVERDVEAPDVFQISDKGLWDGRPSLGGVWVAHGDVTDPERVIIRNTTNGKFVIGALFKRERTAPGPSIQVSSDAAEALGLLAGSPADLNVTALRREEVAQAPEPAQIATLEPSETIQTASLDDPIKDAAATLAASAPTAPITQTAPQASPAPKPAAAALPTQPKASALSKPYIQIGIFSVKDNADRTVKMLGSQGLVAIVKEGETSGKAFWRVVVGPSSSASERKGLLEKVKKSGFSDAYFVTH